MPTDLFVDYMPGQLDVKLNTSVSTAPSSGTVETWSVIVPLGLNLVVPGSVVGQYRGFIESEIVYWTAGAVTNGVQPWTVKRAMEGTVAAFHAAGAILLLDATAGSLANMVQLSPSAPQSGGIAVTGELVGTDFAPAAVTGATASARYFRATASGSPTTGTWALGDVVPDQTGKIWMCTSAGTPGTWTDIAPSSGMINPMTTTQDLIVGGASGAPARLGVGANATVLTVTGGVVGWAAPVTGFTNPMNTPGDTIIGGASGAATRLAAGTANQVLGIDGASGLPLWQTLPLNVMINNGDMIYDAGGADVAGGLSPGNYTASSSYSSGIPQPYMAFDGAVNGQSWIANTTAPGSWLQVDLGTAQAVSQSTWWGAGIITYHISGSNDATSWTTIASKTPTSTSADLLVFPATVSYRYFRFYIDSANPPASLPSIDLWLLQRAVSPTRLPIGTTGQVLTVVGGIPTWSTPAAGLTNPMTTAGDLILGGSGGAAGRLAKGADSFVLTIDPTTHLPVWAASTGGFSNPMSAVGDIIIGGASGAATRLAAGATAYVLTMMSGSPAWAAATGGSQTGASVNKVQLNYVANTDLLSGVSTTIGSWTSFGPSNNFTVDDAASLLDVIVDLGMDNSYSAGGVTAIAILVDGTTLYKINSVTNATAGGIAYSNGGSVNIGSLTAGTHTIQMQYYCDTATTTIYLRAATQAYREYLCVQVIERKVVATGAGGTLDQVRAYTSGNASIDTSNTETALTFDSNDAAYTTNASMHSTSSNTGRLVAQVAGRYHITGFLRFDTLASGIAQLRVRLNGSTEIATSKESQVASTAATVSCDYYLSVGDYVELTYNRDSGGGTVTGGKASFSMYRTDGYAINPMTAVGDMEYGASGGVPTRLPAATQGMALQQGATVPQWQWMQAKTKAGTPVDGDFTSPQDGLIVVDSANSKIWTRISGVWKGVVVA